MGNAVAPAGFRVVNIDMNDPEALAQMQRVFTESLAGMVAPQLPSDAAIEAARSGARAALAASIAKVPLPSTEHTLCAMVANTGQRLIAGTPVHLISDDYLRCDDPDTEPSEDVMVVTRYNHKTGLVGVGPQLECGPFFHPIQTILSSVRVHNIAEAALCVDVLRGERQDNECAAVPQLLRRFEETGSIRAQHKIAVKHAVWDLSFGQLKYHAVAQILDAEAQPPAREHSSSTETLAKVLATGGHKRLIWGFFDIKVDVDLPVRIVSISPTLHARSGVLPRGHDNDEEQIEKMLNGEGTWTLSQQLPYGPSWNSNERKFDESIVLGVPTGSKVLGVAIAANNPGTANQAKVEIIEHSMVDGELVVCSIRPFIPWGHYGVRSTVTAPSPWQNWTPTYFRHDDSVDGSVTMWTILHT